MPLSAQVTPATPDIPVVVVGDTHGQLHDVCSMYVPPMGLHTLQCTNDTMLGLVACFSSNCSQGYVRLHSAAAAAAATAADADAAATAADADANAATVAAAASMRLLLLPF